MEQELIYPSGAHELTPVLSGVGIYRSLTLCFVDLCSSFWPFCCRSFFDSGILIAHFGIFTLFCNYLCLHVYCSSCFVLVSTYILYFFLSGMCWEEKYTCDSVPSTGNSSWLLDNGVWYWLHCCCCVRITKWGLYRSMLVFYIEPIKGFQKTWKEKK